MPDLIKHQCGRKDRNEGEKVLTTRGIRHNPRRGIIKGECIRPGTPVSLEDARRLIKVSLKQYNDNRLNSAAGYITPKDMLARHQQEIEAERDRKLEAAREQRKNRRRRAG